jgi:hypothetical protein
MSRNRSISRVRNSRSSRGCSDVRYELSGSPSGSACVADRERKRISRTPPDRNSRQGPRHRLTARLSDPFYFARFLPLPLRRMILLGHTLSELHSQNRVARTRTERRSKKSGSETKRTKKGRAEVPCQKVTVAVTLSTAAKAYASCKL